MSNGRPAGPSKKIKGIQRSYIGFAEAVSEQILTSDRCDTPQATELVKKIEEATKRYDNGDIGDTAFLLGIKQIRYRWKAFFEPDLEQTHRFIRAELEETIATDYEISEIVKEARKCWVNPNDKQNGIDYVSDDLIGFWFKAAETARIRGTIAVVLASFMVVLLLIYLLFPIIDAIDAFFIVFIDPRVIRDSFSGVDMVDVDSAWTKCYVAWRNFFDVLSRMEEIKAITIGGLGAIISIASSSLQKSSLGVFASVHFVGRTIGRFMTGIWAAILVNLMFRGLFQGAVQSLEFNEDSSVVVLEALRALAMFAAGFSERFFDRLAIVATKKLGFEFQAETSAAGGGNGRSS